MLDSKREIIYIFNLSHSQENEILSHSIDWVEQFTRHFMNIGVFTMEWDGDLGKQRQISIVQLKRNKHESKFMVILRTLRSLKTIYLNRSKACVFFHMNHKPIIIVGIFLRFWNVPSGLWYSHRKNSVLLKVSEKIVNYVFSPTLEAFPVQSKKLLVTGHGISQIFLGQVFQGNRLNALVHLGRVASVKRIEDVIFALSTLPNTCRRLDLIGSVSNLEYKSFLLEVAEKVGVSINFLGAKKKHELINLLKDYSVCFSGTQRSIDKAPLEAASLGCFIVSPNKELLRLTGMNALMEKHAYSCSMNYSLQSQLEFILLSGKFDNKADRIVVSDITRGNNSLSSTINRISLALKSGRTYNE